jgi:hypothetical protein
MGLETQLKKWLLTSKRRYQLCLRRVEEKKQPHVVPYPSGVIEIEDALTRVNAWRGHYLTGQNVYVYYIGPILRRFISGKISLFVGCVDKAWLVPKRKEAEQRRRDMDRKKAAEKKKRKQEEEKEEKDKLDGNNNDDDIPVAPTNADVYKRMMERYGIDDTKYPPDAKICDGGIELRGTSGLTVVVPIDINKLLAVRSLKRALFRYLHEKVLADTRMAKFRVILDYDIYPFAVYGGKTMELRTNSHCIGEGELMTAYWANLWRDRDILFRTIDGDILPIIALYNETAKPTGQLWWQFSSTDAVDLKQLYVELKINAPTIVDPGINATIFTILCCLCGTDYCDKSDLLYFVSVPFICQRLVDGSKVILEKFGLSASYLSPKTDELWPPPIGIAFTKDEYNRDPADDPRASAIREMVESLILGCSNPRGDWNDVDTGMRNLHWNLQYWMLNYNATQMRHPQPDFDKCLTSGMRHLPTAIPSPPPLPSSSSSSSSSSSLSTPIRPSPPPPLLVATPPPILAPRPCPSAPKRPSFRKWNSEEKTERVMLSSPISDFDDDDDDHSEPVAVFNVDNLEALLSVPLPGDKEEEETEKETREERIARLTRELAELHEEIAGLEKETTVLKKSLLVVVGFKKDTT